MAWEWSHTQGAYLNAQENLKSLSRDELNVIYSEIEVCKLINQDNEYITQDTFNFDCTYAEKMKLKAETIPSDILIDFIWNFMEQELRTCDNGGFNAWCCPYGCHTDSFDGDL